MSFITSSHFASTIQTGTDWRDTSKKTLETLEKARTEGDNFNIGFLYVSDHLSEDLTSILNLFKSVLNIENWVGCVGIGVCANGVEHIDTPAISAMIGHLPEEQFHIFQPLELAENEGEHALCDWLEENDPMLVFAHGTPAGEEDPALLIKKLDNLTGGFVAGGLSSARKDYGQIAQDIHEDGISGIAFSIDMAVASSLSQGCTRAGPRHTITRGEDHTILELDHEKALHVFESDMRKMVMERIGQDPDEIKIDESALENLEALPEDLKHLFKGEMHAAFPVSGSDQRDYLVRNVIGMDERSGALQVAHHITAGEQVLFVYRDDNTVREDLTKTMIDLRKRVERDTGAFKPKAGIYVSCLARAFCDFQKTGEPLQGQCGEMKLIRDILGDFPLTGFYAGGEINKGRLYGYTGILTLFL